MDFSGLLINQGRTLSVEGHLFDLGGLPFGAILLPHHFHPAPGSSTLTPDGHDSFDIYLIPSQTADQREVEFISSSLLQWCAQRALESDRGE